MKPTEQAYLAGLIDGEGTISVVTNTAGYLVRYVQLVSTDRDIITWFATVCGNGTTRTGTGFSPKGHRTKPVHRHAVVGKTATKICRTLLPYLRLKKRQAELILELTTIQESWKAPGRGYRLEKGKTYRDFTRQKQILTEFRKLNKRGVA